MPCFSLCIGQANADTDYLRDALVSAGKPASTQLPSPSEVCSPPSGASYSVYGINLDSQAIRVKAAVNRYGVTIEYGPDNGAQYFGYLCKYFLEACRAGGLSSCDLQGCVPSHLQWACVEPPPEGTQRSYMFGDSLDRAGAPPWLCLVVLVLQESATLLPSC